MEMALSLILTAVFSATLLYCKLGEGDLEGPLVHSLEAVWDLGVIGRGDGGHQQDAIQHLFYSRCWGCPSHIPSSLPFQYTPAHFSNSHLCVSFCLRALTCHWHLLCHPAAYLQCWRINISQEQLSANDWWIASLLYPLPNYDWVE